MQIIDLAIVFSVRHRFTAKLDKVTYAWWKRTFSFINNYILCKL
jgi:hypothetical protein